MPTVQEMINQSDYLTKTQTKIFEYILNHPEVVCYSTLRNLAERIGVSEVSVLNVCRKLGCSGYAEMKLVLRSYIAERLQAAFGSDYTLEKMDEFSPKDKRTTLNALFEQDQSALTALSDSVSEEQIFSCARTLIEVREVQLFGHDASKILADFFAHRLGYLRIHATSIRLDDNDAVQASLANLSSDDALVVFSFPPYYRAASNVARYGIYCGAKVISITDGPKSPAVLKGVQNLYCPTKTKFFFNSLTAPISLINVMTSCMALEMGPPLDYILQEELRVTHLMNGESPSNDSIQQDSAKSATSSQLGQKP